MVQMRWILVALLFGLSAMVVNGQEGPPVANPEPPKEEPQEPLVKDLPRAEQLIRIRIEVAGTGISLRPWYVEQIVSDPAAEMKRMKAAGAKEQIGLPDSVVLDATMYSFYNAEKWESRFGLTLPMGAVVYSFRLDTAGQRDAMIAEQKLESVGHVRGEKTPSREVFKASDGFYVRLLIPSGQYTCPVHTDISTESDGKCVICGAALILREE